MEEIKKQLDFIKTCLDAMGESNFNTLKNPIRTSVKRIEKQLLIHSVVVPEGTLVCGECNKPLYITDTGDLHCGNQCGISKTN